MPAKYYVTLTHYGAQLVAEAHHVQTINLTELVIGDANDIPYLPVDKKDLTQLVHQTAAVEIREIKIADGIATVSAIIPANIGGFNIHEIGLKDASGQLVYIGNYHGAYKPVIAEGAGGELEIVIDIKASAGAEVLIEINPLIISADKAWVLEKFNELMEAIKNREDVKVGDLYLTTINFETPEAVAAHKGFGAWERFGDGHALVARASDLNEIAPSWMKTIGNSDGEYKHALTADENAKHVHRVVATRDEYNGVFYDNANGFILESKTPANISLAIKSDRVEDDNYTILPQEWASSGKGKPHNNIQPSIIIGIWKRTA